MNNRGKNFLLHKKWYITVLEVFAMFIALIALLNYLNPREQFVHLAAVIPSNLDQEGTGQSVKDALTIYAERINKYGGINGKKLAINFYDDQGEVATAQKIAHQIANDGKTVAVLGHFLDRTTQAAGEIYSAKGLPVISPISNIEPDRNWRFQLSPTREFYGIYMAYYIRCALKQDQVSIVRSDDGYEAVLLDAFTKQFIALGGSVKNTFSIDHNISSHNDTKIQAVTKRIKDNITNNHHNFLLIATHEKQSIPLIATIKQQHINTKIMITQGSLLNKFKNIRPRYFPGYYSGGIYSPAIIIPDSINKPSLALVRKDYEIRQNKKISSTAMTTTLAAVSLINILKKKQFIYIDDNQIARQKLKQVLQHFAWYNNDQIGIESVLMFGIYHKNTLITAPINPIVVKHGDLSQFNKDKHEDKLLKINNKTLYMTNYVYTGVSMKSIEKINLDQLSYNLDFFLWFRYKKGIDGADNVEFINSTNVSKLSDLIEKQKNKKQSKKNIDKTTLSGDYISAELVESQTVGNEVYHRYHIKGRFKTSKQKNYTVGQQNLYIRFRNNKYNTYQLRYLTDYNNAHNGIFHPEDDKTNYTLIDNTHLKLNYNFDYISTSKKTSLGNPRDLKQSIRYSEFIAEYRIESSLWSFRGLAAWVNKKLSGREDQIKTTLMIFLLAVSYAIFQLIRYIKRRNSMSSIPNYLWLLQLFSIFLILLFGEFALSQAIFDLKYSMWGEQNRTEINILMLYTGYIIAILWWIIPAYYIASAVDQFLWQPIQHHTGTKIPAVLHLFIVIIIYMIAALGIMAFVFKVTITGLAATSGLIAIIFALASKVDLSNIIAGLGISFSKTFNLGDWVKINNSIEGKIIELTPRSTNILTSDSAIISIPNTIVANAVIKNYNRPNTNFRLEIYLELDENYQSERIEKILLNAVYNTEGVLADPPSLIYFKGQDGSGKQAYDIFFHVHAYEERHLIKENVWRNIWHVLEKNKSDKI